MLSTKMLRGSIIDSSLVSDGILTTIGTQAGATAFLPFGVEVTWPGETLERIHKTWQGGRVGANHSPEKDFGEILDVQYDGENAFFTVSVDEELRSQIEKNIDSVGVSIEAANPEVDNDGNITDAEGTGISFIFFPDDPACTPEDGCEILGSVPKELVEGIPDDLLLLAHGENLADIIAEVNAHDCECGGGDGCDCHSEEKIFEAAKLTTKKRKALPAGSFCGPDRSFPANDAAHVRNGMARLGVFKGENKSRIARCLVRKAKQFGVEVSDDFKKKYGISGGEPTTTNQRGNNMPEDGNETLAKLLEEVSAIRKGNSEEIEALKKESSGKFEALQKEKEEMAEKLLAMETVEEERKKKAEAAEQEAEAAKQEAERVKNLTPEERSDILHQLSQQLEDARKEREELTQYKLSKVEEEKRVALSNLERFGIEDVTRYERFDTDDLRMLVKDLEVVAWKIGEKVETGSGAKIMARLDGNGDDKVLAAIKKRYNQLLGYKPEPEVQ